MTIINETDKSEEGMFKKDLYGLGLVVTGSKTSLFLLGKFYDFLTKAGALEKITKNDYLMTKEGFEMTMRRMEGQYKKELSVPRDYVSPAIGDSEGVIVRGRSHYLYPLELHYDWLVDVGAMDKVSEGKYVLGGKGLKMVLHQLKDHRNKKFGEDRIKRGTRK